MIVYKFCRTDLYELCLGEFEVSPSAKINFYTHDTVDVSEFTLLQTYLYENNTWVKKDIDTLYSVIQLNGAAVFPKRQLVKSNLERGFYAFTSHSAQYFDDYRIHFKYQVDYLKEQASFRECSS